MGRGMKSPDYIAHGGWSPRERGGGAMPGLPGILELRRGSLRKTTAIGDPHVIRGVIPWCKRQPRDCTRGPRDSVLFTREARRALHWLVGPRCRRRGFGRARGKKKKQPKWAGGNTTQRPREAFSFFFFLFSFLFKFQFQTKFKILFWTSHSKYTITSQYEYNSYCLP
jgi:hypothetical protein